MLKLRYSEKDENIEVGIDEAGRGSLWGPLYAAAVVWIPTNNTEQETLTPLIKDSKKITPKRRTALAKSIKEHALDWGIGSVSPQEIDTIGMTKANQLAFTRALDNLSIKPERLIIDGCLSIYQPPWSMVEQVVEVEADNNYVSVAAASILAKVEHDEWVERFCAQHSYLEERYDLVKNKGYGTAKHMAGIRKWGEDPQHRKLFLRKLHASASSKEEQGQETKGDSLLETTSD
jgi:ribonuclease HII